MLSALKARFRPEFLNRVDDIVYFDPLGKEILERIAVHMLQELRQRGESIGLSIDFAEALPRFLVNKSFSATYGARPLRRAILRLIEDPLSTHLLERRFQKGDRIWIKPDERMERLLFDKQ